MTAVLRCPHWQLMRRRPSWKWQNSTRRRRRRRPTRVRRQPPPSLNSQRRNMMLRTVAKMQQVNRENFSLECTPRFVDTRTASRVLCCVTIRGMSAAGEHPDNGTASCRGSRCWEIAAVPASHVELRQSPHADAASAAPPRGFAIVPTRCAGVCHGASQGSLMAVAVRMRPGKRPVPSPQPPRQVGPIALLAASTRLMGQVARLCGTAMRSPQRRAPHAP